MDGVRSQVGEVRRVVGGTRPRVGCVRYQVGGVKPAATRAFNAWRCISSGLWHTFFSCFVCLGRHLGVLLVVALCTCSCITADAALLMQESAQLKPSEYHTACLLHMQL